MILEIEITEYNIHYEKDILYDGNNFICFLLHRELYITWVGWLS